jgi:nucleoside 2-deoxyribosyltransferase
MQPTVYLAGPIAGCTESQANDWRRQAAKALGANYNIKAISPLRCEPLVGDRYQVVYDDPKFGSAMAIAGKNIFDVRRCDMLLAYLPVKNFSPSVGTICEIGWAYALGKQTVLVSDSPAITGHPLMQAQCHWILPSLDDAIEVIGGVLGAYAFGGRNV